GPYGADGLRRLPARPVPVRGHQNDAHGRCGGPVLAAAGPAPRGRVAVVKGGPVRVAPADGAAAAPRPPGTIDTGYAGTGVSTPVTPGEHPLPGAREPG